MKCINCSVDFFSSGSDELFQGAASTLLALSRCLDPHAQNTGVALKACGRMFLSLTPAADREHSLVL